MKKRQRVGIRQNDELRLNNHHIAQIKIVRYSLPLRSRCLLYDNTIVLDLPLCNLSRDEVLLG